MCTSKTSQRTERISSLICFLTETYIYRLKLILQPIRLHDTVPARFVRVNILSVSGGEPAGMYKVDVYGRRK